MNKIILRIILVILIIALSMPVCVIASAEAQEMRLSREDRSVMRASSYSELAAELKTVANAANQRIAKLYDLDKTLIQGYIRDAEAKLERLKTLQSGQAEYSKLQTEISDLCNKILVASAESKVVSARSTWHRPCESTYAGIEENVKMFRDVGINIIFVETFYHGCSAFKSDEPNIPYHPSLASTYTDTKKGIVYNDYLSAFIACCKAYGIEVHAWVENFYVGINANIDIVKNNPDWVVYNDDGTITQRKEGGAYIFIDPASKEVQDLLINYYNELFAKHPDVAGLNLDYIRYPVSNRSVDTGYTIAAMKGFFDLMDLEFTDAQLASRTKMANRFKQLFDKNYLYGGQVEADANYSSWVAYRTDVITNFVRRIQEEVKKPNNIVLSTAVFAPLSDSITQKKADWQKWYANGWIDIATPMAYYTASSTVETRVKEMISIGGSNCLYYTGIASSYSGLPAWQNKEFIEASNRAGANGYVIFSSAQIVGHADVQLALSSGVNSKWAVLPHAEIHKILTASFADILDKADRLYIPAGGMTTAGREAVKCVFESIIAELDTSAAGIYRAYNRVNALTQTELANYATGYAHERMTQQLNELASILNARISITLVRDGTWNPETGASRPTLEELEIPAIPEDPTTPEEPDAGNNMPAEELTFFQKLWKAILEFFQMLFGIKN